MCECWSRIGEFLFCETAYDLIERVDFLFSIFDEFGRARADYGTMTGFKVACLIAGDDAVVKRNLKADKRIQLEDFYLGATLRGMKIECLAIECKKTGTKKGRFSRQRAKCRILPL